MDTTPNASFWLPSHFLSDDSSVFGPDPFDNDENSIINNNTPPLLDGDDTSLLSHLTRHFAKTTLHDPPPPSERPWMFSTSPQSTLSGFGNGWSGNNNSRSGFTSNGSPNGPSRVPSPPLTPEIQNDAAWDLLYEAAGQVARLKMNAIAAQLNNRSLLGTPRQQWGQERMCQSAWPPLTATRQARYNTGEGGCGRQVTGIYQGGPEVKRQSVGTGVFLPRVSTSPPRQQKHHFQQPRHPAEFRRNSPVFVPTRASNLDFEEVNLKSYARNNGPTGFSTDREHMMAMRSAILAQQRRNFTRPANNNNKGATACVSLGQGLGMGQGHEIRLPTDWTY